MNEEKKENTFKMALFFYLQEVTLRRNHHTPLAPHPVIAVPTTSSTALEIFAVSCNLCGKHTLGTLTCGNISLHHSAANAGVPLVGPISVVGLLAIAISAFRSTLL